MGLYRSTESDCHGLRRSRFVEVLEEMCHDNLLYIRVCMREGREELQGNTLRRQTFLDKLLSSMMSGFVALQLVLTNFEGKRFELR